MDGLGVTTTYDANGNSPSTSDGTEAIEAYYGFQIDLSTSFTGEDSLDVSLDGGNSGGAAAELDLNSTTDEALTVDGISYTFPIGDKVTAFVGDNTDGSFFTAQLVYTAVQEILLMTVVQQQLL